MYVAYAVMNQTHHLIRGSAMDSLVPYACYKSTSEPKSHGSKPRDITCNKEHRSDRSRRELLLPAHLFDRIRFPKEKCVRAWGGCQALSISNLLRVPAKNYLQGYRIHIASYSNTRDSMKKTRHGSSGCPTPIIPQQGGPIAAVHTPATSHGTAARETNNTSAWNASPVRGPGLFRELRQTDACSRRGSHETLGQKSLRLGG